jgi:hypothetical protein
MFAAGVAALIIGYALLYTGIMNLLNAGKGPKLFEAMGFTTKLVSPADYKTDSGSANLVGPVPSAPLDSPGGVVNV